MSEGNIVDIGEYRAKLQTLLRTEMDKEEFLQNEVVTLKAQLIHYMHVFRQLNAENNYKLKEWFELSKEAKSEYVDRAMEETWTL